MPKISFGVPVVHAAVHRFMAAVTGCAAIAVGCPTLVLLSRSRSVGTDALAVAGSLMALLLMVHLLRPLAVVAWELRACLADDPLDEAPTHALVRDPRGAGGMVGDVARLKSRIEGWRHRLARRHPITGLPTREPFLSAMGDDLKRSDRDAVLGVIRFADYDRLAAFDQAAADSALRAFADRLKASLPPARLVAQVDRNCFAIWFREGGGRDLATRELQALGYVLGQDLVAGDLMLTPNLSIGASIFPDDGALPLELLTRAVAAVEAGQQAGKAVAFLSQTGTADARERFSLEQSLRHAVGRDEFLLHYQPVVDLNAGEVIGAEALLRWRHPTLGLIPPARFIPILEQSPMMAEVGLWALNAACREARAWRDSGRTDVKVAVNLSTTQCRDPRLNNMVLRTLQRHGLPAHCLELELTETAAMEDADHTRRLLAALREQGVSVAIDDFGAGYSNLSYLKNLPFSKLKIDREFVTDVDVRRDSRAICAALITLAQGLGIDILAEGVERFEEVETLHAMGCSLFQGFYFARPMDGAAFRLSLQDPSWSGRLAGCVAGAVPEVRKLAR